MGCNTSQEAMQAVENKAAGAAKAKSQAIMDESVKKMNNVAHDVKTNVEEEIGKFLKNNIMGFTLSIRK